MSFRLEFPTAHHPLTFLFYLLCLASRQQLGLGIHLRLRLYHHKKADP